MILPRIASKKKQALVIFWLVFCIVLYFLLDRKAPILYLVGAVCTIGVILLIRPLRDEPYIRWHWVASIGLLATVAGFLLGLALFDFWPYALIILPMAALLVGMVLQGKYWIDFLKRR